MRFAAGHPLRRPVNRDGRRFWAGNAARLAIAAAALCSPCLTGCQSTASYEPLVTDISNPALLEADRAQCRAVAEAYKPGPDLGAVLQSGTQGALQEAPAAAVGATAPLLGAAGSGGSELLAEIGILSDKQIRIFLRCLDHRGQKSGAYSVIDPNF